MTSTDTTAERGRGLLRRRAGRGPRPPGGGGTPDHGHLRAPRARRRRARLEPRQGSPTAVTSTSGRPWRAPGSTPDPLQRHAGADAPLVWAPQPRFESRSPEARGFLDLADTSDPVVAGDTRGPAQATASRSSVRWSRSPSRLRHLAAQHVDCARRASQDVTPPALLEPVTLDRSIRTAGEEFGRADEDVRFLGDVLDHAATSARQSAAIAAEISDNAHHRMSEHGRDPVPSAVAPAPGAEPVGRKGGRHGPRPEPPAPLPAGAV